MDKQAVFSHVQLQELYVLHHDHRENPQILEAMISPEFYEISSAGSIVERAPVIQWLMQKNPQARWEMTDCRAEMLTPTLVMLVYHARQVEAVKKPSSGSWRTSVWRKPRNNEQWQMQFHQATPVI